MADKRQRNREAIQDLAEKTAADILAESRMAEARLQLQCKEGPIYRKWKRRYQAWRKAQKRRKHHKR